MDRRQSYDLNEDGLFNVEYADVLGIPFDFAAKPVISLPIKPRETVRVHAVKPERDALEIVFPRVEGYRVELPNERLEATFGPDHVLNLNPEMVGPSVTKNQGIIGEGVDLTITHLEDMRSSTRRIRKCAPTLRTRTLASKSLISPAQHRGSTFPTSSYRSMTVGRTR
jgi:type III restriction enzyme